MAIERAKAYLKTKNLDTKVLEFNVSSATVELAAAALGTTGARIAKSLSLSLPDGDAILIVTAGDTKIDNKKYKERFGAKAKMLSFDEVEEKIGHAVGGVCPFGINDGVKVYLDESMKRFETIFPAAGSSNSAIEIVVSEFENIAQNFCSWVDVCKLPE